MKDLEIRIHYSVSMYHAAYDIKYWIGHHRLSHGVMLSWHLVPKHMKLNGSGSYYTGIYIPKVFAIL